MYIHLLVHNTYNFFIRHKAKHEFWLSLTESVDAAGSPWQTLLPLSTVKVVLPLSFYSITLLPLSTFKVGWPLSFLSITLLPLSTVKAGWPLSFLSITLLPLSTVKFGWPLSFLSIEQSRYAGPCPFYLLKYTYSSIAYPRNAVLVAIEACTAT